MPPILDPDQSYTSRQFSDLPFEPEDILAELGYSLDRAELNLGCYPDSLERLAESEIYYAAI